MRHIETTNKRLTTVELTDEELQIIHALAAVSEAGDASQPPHVRSGEVKNGRRVGGSVICTPFAKLLHDLGIEQLDGLSKPR